MPKPFPAVALLEWTRSCSDRCAAELLGVNRNSGSRWRASDRHFTVEEAEDFCDRLRVHPSEVWPDWYDHLVGT